MHARINVANADSLYRKESDILFFDYAGEIEYAVNRLKNFGMNLSLKYIFERIAAKEQFTNLGD